MKARIRDIIGSCLCIILVCMCVYGWLQYQETVKNYEQVIDTQKEILYNKENEILVLKNQIEHQNTVILECQQEIENLSIKDREIDIRVTHYSAEETGTSMTASGKHAEVGRTVACNFLPLGTHVIIDGNEYIVEDTGGMTGNTVDIYVGSSAEAMSKGVYYTTMKVLD